MITCPRCHHQWKDEAKAAAGRKRWAKVGKAKRKAAMRKAAIASHGQNSKRRKGV